MSTLNSTIDALLHEPEANVLDSSSIEIGGVKIVEIKNKRGRVWAVPADDGNVDINEGGLKNILNIPKPEKDFYYQFIRDDQLGDYLGRDFALVEPEDVGLPAKSSDAATAAVGIRPTSHHQVGNMHLVMIPKVIEQRYRRAEKMRADEAVAGIKQSRQTIHGKDVKQVSDTDVQVHSRKTTVEAGKPIVTANPGFKEFSET